MKMSSSGQESSAPEISEITGEEMVEVLENAFFQVFPKGSSSSSFDWYPHFKWALDFSKHYLSLGYPQSTIQGYISDIRVVFIVDGSEKDCEKAVQSGLLLEQAFPLKCCAYGRFQQNGPNQGEIKRAIEYVIKDEFTSNTAFVVCIIAHANQKGESNSSVSDLDVRADGNGNQRPREKVYDINHETYTSILTQFREMAAQRAEQLQLHDDAQYFFLPLTCYSQQVQNQVQNEGHLFYWIRLPAILGDAEGFYISNTGGKYLADKKPFHVLGFLSMGAIVSYLMEQSKK